MKRADLVRHLERNGCVLLREGAKHFVNGAGNESSTVARHRGIKGFPARKICRDLQVPEA